MAIKRELPPIRDTASRCDPSNYNSMFHVGNHPNLKKASAVMPHQRDTLEVLQTDLKKDALERLRHTSKFFISQPNFMRVGKYLFLGVTMPPYLLIYRIPKWILVEMIPIFYTQCANLAFGVKKAVQKWTEPVGRRFIHMMQFMQKIVKVAITPVQKGLLYVKNVIQRLRQNVFSFMVRLRERLKEPFPVKIAMKKLQQRLTNIFKRVRDRAVEAKEWVSKDSPSVLAPLKAGIEWLREFPVGLAVKSTEFMVIQFKAQKNRLAVNWKNSQQVAQHATEWLSKQVKATAQDLKKLGEQVKILYQAWIKPALRQVKATLNAQWTQAREFLNDKRKRAQKWIEELQSKWGAKNPNDMLAKLFAEHRFTWVPLFIRRAVKRFFSDPGVQEAIRLGYWMLTQSIYYSYLGLKEAIKLIVVGAVLVKQGVQTGVHFVRVAIQEVFKYVGVAFSMVGTATGKVIYGTLVLAVMSSILLVQAIQTLGETSNYLLASTFRRVKVEE